MQFGQIWIFYPGLDSNMKENINKRSHHLPPPYLPPTSTTFQKSWKCQVSTTFACFCWININLWTKMANIRPGRDYRENFPPEYNIPQILVRQTHLEFQYLSKDFHHWATWQEKPPWGPSSCPPQEPKLEADPIRKCSCRWWNFYLGSELFRSVKYSGCDQQCMQFQDNRPILTAVTDLPRFEWLLGYSKKTGEPLEHLQYIFQLS